jgi:leader peptidase (prepilin peptidase)/N-methyltransferase
VNPWLELPLGFARIIVGAYGLVVGSFLNVVIHRVPRGISVVTPRSACPSCGRIIPWWENLPVVSWLALRARCSGCRSPISFRYPAVEMLTAVILLLALERFGMTLGLAAASLFLVLVLALMFIDFEHMLLPDALTIPGTFAGLALSFVSPLTTPGDALAGALLGIFTIEGMNLAYKLVRGRDGFGAGDTKMLMMMGAFLGWQDVILVLVLASFVGVAVTFPVLLVLRHRDAGTTTADESPEPDSPADGAPEAGDEPPMRRAVLLDVVPEGLDEWLALLTAMALAASFLVPGQAPERSLAGCLVGIVLLVAARRTLSSGTRLPWYLPFVGAAAGLPPSAAGAAVGVAIAGGIAIAARRMPSTSASVAREDAEGADAAPAQATDSSSPDAPTLMQAAIPFGVFLGIAAMLTLFGGDQIVDWYLSFSERLFGTA